jgi:hypothetical protein
MAPAYSREVLCVTLRVLADHARSSKLALEETDWQTVLTLERNLGARPLPPSIHALAASRRERRVAFGGALFRANQQAGECPHDPSPALWSAMAALPSGLGSASNAMSNPNSEGTAVIALQSACAGWCWTSASLLLGSEQGSDESDPPLPPDGGQGADGRWERAPHLALPR